MRQAMPSSVCKTKGWVGLDCMLIWKFTLRLSQEFV
jgi:hypothetical protein